VFYFNVIHYRFW